MKKSLKNLVLTAVIFGTLSISGTSCMTGSRGLGHTNDGPRKGGGNRGRNITNDKGGNRGREHTNDRGRDRTMVVLKTQDFMA